MSNYSSLKSAIDANIKANGRREITGPVLNAILNAVVNSLGDGYLFRGVAIPSTNPGTPDQNVAYLAITEGTYTHMGGLSVTDGELSVFSYNGAWSKIPLALVPTKTSQLDNDLRFVTSEEMGESLSSKQDTIQDLSEIRSGAALGSTAYQKPSAGIPASDMTDTVQQAISFAESTEKRSYNSSNPDGMGYVVLKKNKTFAEQVTEENTIYEIRNDFDLGGASVIIPGNCVLYFNGGSVGNGTIVGTLTVLDGLVKIDKMSGSFVGEVRSSFSTMPTNYSKLSMLMSLTIGELVLDENFSVSLSDSIHTNIPNIKGQDCKISVTSGANIFLIVSAGLNRIEGITFDFNGNNAKGAIYTETRGDVSFADIRIKNIKNTESFVHGIGLVLDDDSNCSISDITLTNLSCLGNGTIGEVGGAIYGIMVANAGLLSDIIIDSVVASDIYNFDSSNVRIKEDAAAIYVANSQINTNESNVVLSNINATNSGKRVIKTDCRILTIKNITIKTDDGCNENAIGLNSGDTNVTDGMVIIDNVTFDGTKGNVVATSIPNVKLSNVIAKYLNAGITGQSIIEVAPSLNKVTCENITCENCSLVKDQSTSDRTEPIKFNNVYMSYDKGNDDLYFLTVMHTNLIISNLFLSANGNITFNYYGIDIGQIVFHSSKFDINTSGNFYMFEYAGKCKLSFFNTIFKHTGRGIFFLGNCAWFEMKGCNIIYESSVSTALLMLGIFTFTSDFENFFLDSISLKNPGSRYFDMQLRNSSGGDILVKVVNDVLVDISASTNTIGFNDSYPRLFNNDISKISTAKYARMSYRLPDSNYYRFVKKTNGWSPIDSIALSTANRESITLALEKGVSVFDTSLGKMVVWNGSAWVNMDGSAL